MKRNNNAMVLSTILGSIFLTYLSFGTAVGHAGGKEELIPEVESFLQKEFKAIIKDDPWILLKGRPPKALSTGENFTGLPRIEAAKTNPEELPPETLTKFGVKELRPSLAPEAGLLNGTREIGEEGFDEVAAETISGEVSVPITREALKDAAVENEYYGIQLARFCDENTSPQALGVAAKSLLDKSTRFMKSWLAPSLSSVIAEDAASEAMIRIKQRCGWM